MPLLRARSMIFGVVTLLSVIILLIGAPLVHWRKDWFWGHVNHATFSAEIAIISLTLPIKVYFGRRFPENALSSVVVELCWTGLLSILWFTSAYSTAESLEGYLSCGGDRKSQAICARLNAIETFAFINGILLMAYFFALLASSILAVRAGHRSIWFQPVEETDFGGIGSDSGYDSEDVLHT